MATYIVMSKLTDEGAKTLKKNPGRLIEVNAELKQMGVDVLDQFAVLGNFDFLNIVEAADEITLSKALVELSSRGRIRTETYSAIPVKDFIESLK